MSQIMRAFFAVALLAGSLALLAMLASVMAPVNVADTLPIRCGHKLRDTCHPSGVVWP